MSDKNNKNRYEKIDFFAQIACGGNKRLVTRIPRLAEIPPLETRGEELPEVEKHDIKIPEFNEKKGI